MFYRVVPHWSIRLGMEAARLSVFDDRGGEHYAIIGQDGTGRQNREAREAVLERLAAHARSGAEPGEVDVG